MPDRHILSATHIVIERQSPNGHILSAGDVTVKRGISNPYIIVSSGVLVQGGATNRCIITSRLCSVPPHIRKLIGSSGKLVQKEKGDGNSSG